MSVAKKTMVQLMRGVKSRPPASGCHDTYAWDSQDSQTDYFNTKIVYAVEGNSYQRVYDGTFRCKIDETTLATNNLYTCNYMRIYNALYEGQYIYAWITGATLIANGTLEFEYIIDDIQTWYFNYTERQCWIERMTYSYIIDKAGVNLNPEPIDPSDPVVIDKDNLDLIPITSEGFASFYLYIGTTFDVWDDSVSYQTSLICGIPTAIKYVRFHVIVIDGKQWIEYVTDDGAVETSKTLSKWLEEMTEQSKFDSIVSATLVPEQFNDQWHNKTAPRNPITKQINGVSYNEITYPDGSTYTPRHKKLYCAPYTFLRVFNGLGDKIDLYYELFDDPQNLTFFIYGNIIPASTIYCHPYRYAGYNSNDCSEYGLTMSNYPSIAIATDSYKAWLAQNQGQIASNVANTVIGGIANVIKNPLSGVLNLITGAISTAGEFYDKSRQPATVKGTQADGTALVSGVQDFYFYHMASRKEFMAMADSFFDMFGYAENSLGVPTRISGRYYTYTKTAGAVMDGDIPADANSRICAIYNNGVRFWRDENFGVYIRDKLN